MVTPAVTCDASFSAFSLLTSILLAGLLSTKHRLPSSPFPAVSSVTVHQFSTSSRHLRVDEIRVSPLVRSSRSSSSLTVPTYLRVCVSLRPLQHSITLTTPMVTVTTETRSSLYFQCRELCPGPNVRILSSMPNYCSVSTTSSNIISKMKSALTLLVSIDGPADRAVPRGKKAKQTDRRTTHIEADPVLTDHIRALHSQALYLSGAAATSGGRRR